MGKKGNWLSTLKKVFLPNSKEKSLESEKRGVKEKKKWGVGKLKHGETTSLRPLYREPSSIEKILGDAEREQYQISHSLPSREQHPIGHSLPSREQHQIGHSLPSKEHKKTHALPNREKQQTLPLPSRVHHHKATATYHPTKTKNNHHIAAIKIQTAYRGYMARMNFRTLKGLMRLQGVVRGPSVKRQTINAMRYMRLVVKIQKQVQSRRIQMMENHALQSHNPLNSSKEEESYLGKQTLTQLDETDYREDWDESMLTKEEIDARMQKKVNAVLKRERALAYAYPHHLWKNSPKPSAITPWWWNSLDQQIPLQAPEKAHIHAINDATPRRSTQASFGLLESTGIATPISTISNLSPITKPSTPRKSTHAKFTMSPITKGKNSPFTARTPQNYTSKNIKASKACGGEFSFDVPLKDDDSLMSCPSFSVPNYMAPTVSAKAKVRAQSNPKERPMASPSGGSKKRLSFHLPQSIGSLRWNKGSLFSGKDSSSQWMSGNHKPIHAIGNLSVDSSLSLPTGVGRKSFK